MALKLLCQNRASKNGYLVLALQVQDPHGVPDTDCLRVDLIDDVVNDPAAAPP
jgi:hypothetical protein